MMANNDCRIIQIFLWCVAAIFLCAFTSLYSQIPGIYGENGIYPAAFVLEDKTVCVDKYRKCQRWSKEQQCQLNSVWMKENCAGSCNSCKYGIMKYLDFPTLLWIVPKLGLTTETGMEFICLIGIFLSFFMLLSKPARDCLNYFILGALYFSLIQVGQVFLYYQWDNLLIETSFFAVVVAPWNLFLGPWNIFQCRRVATYRKKHDNVCFWLVKWLLFRLMFASGIVKLLWMDETWWNLTALNWHYESQCIPNAVAWYMQKLPVPFHRLSVVITYLIEILVPFLFFAPFRAAKKFAFCSQILLQSMILVTGNYNYFNLLTMALCISLLSNQDFLIRCDLIASHMHCLGNTSKEERSQTIYENNKEKLASFPDAEKSENFRISNCEEESVWIAALTKLWDWSEKKIQSKRMIAIKDFVQCQPKRFIKKICTYIMLFIITLVLILISVKYFGLRFDRREFIHSEIKFTQRQFLDGLYILVGLACIIGLISLIFEILTSLASCLLEKFELSVKLLCIFQCLFFGALALWIFGLSLVPLTDLDARARNAIPKTLQKQYKMVEKFKMFNAYGLFRSMTGIGGRPEVVIIGGNSLETNATWKEYNFLYKPGNLYSAPVLNVPHQPRLDWQMWFAALEDFASNPWFINLCYKLLLGEQDVLDLMASNPFKEKPPKYIKSVLYRYHYTMNNTNIWHAIFKSGNEKRWWTREYIDEYMPVISKNDTSVLKLLMAYGLSRNNRSKENHHGFLHSGIVSLRSIVRPFRPEFLIYAKFALLLFLYAIQSWWSTNGVHRIQSRRRLLEHGVKRRLDMILSKIANNSAKERS